MRSQSEQPYAYIIYIFCIYKMYIYVYSERVHSRQVPGEQRVESLRDRTYFEVIVRSINIKKKKEKKKNFIYTHLFK